MTRVPVRVAVMHLPANERNTVVSINFEVVRREADRIGTWQAREVARLGELVADRMVYGPRYSRAAREHFYDGWRMLSFDDPSAWNLAVWQATLAVVAGDAAPCGHPSGDWRRLPGVDRVLECDCGARWSQLRDGDGHVRYTPGLFDGAAADDDDDPVDDILAEAAMESEVIAAEWGSDLA